MTLTRAANVATILGAIFVVWDRIEPLMRRLGLPAGLAVPNPGGGAFEILAVLLFTFAMLVGLHRLRGLERSCEAMRTEIVAAEARLEEKILAEKPRAIRPPWPLSQEQKDHFIAEAYSVIALTDSKTTGSAERMHGVSATAEAICEQERDWAREVSAYLTPAQRESFCADILVPFGISEIQAVAGRMNERLRRLREIPTAV